MDTADEQQHDTQGCEQEVRHAGKAFQTRTRSQGQLEHLAHHLQHSAYAKALAFAR